MITYYRMEPYMRMVPILHRFKQINNKGKEVLKWEQLVSI